MWIIFAARRRFPRNVHDGGPEEVLRRHEEDGKEETCEGHPETTGIYLLIVTKGYLCVGRWMKS